MQFEVRFHQRTLEIITINDQRIQAETKFIAILLLLNRSYKSAKTIDLGGGQRNSASSDEKFNLPKVYTVYTPLCLRDGELHIFQIELVITPY